MQCSDLSMYLPVFLWCFVGMLFSTPVCAKAPGEVQEMLGLVGATGAHPKPSLEQMFADPFLQCLPSPDPSFISSADSFPCSSTSLASWNQRIFSCGVFRGTLGKVSHWLIRHRECKNLLMVSVLMSPSQGVASGASAKSSWLLLKRSWNLQG